MKCETSWISVALKFSISWSGQRRKVASSASPEDTRKSRPSPDATKVIAIVAEKCYQNTWELTNNQNGMARTIFMLFVCQNLIEICVVSLQLAIFTKISRKAAHALLQTKKKKKCWKIWVRLASSWFHTLLLGSPANIMQMGLLWKPGLRFLPIPCCLFGLWTKREKRFPNANLI